MIFKQLPSKTKIVVGLILFFLIIAGGIGGWLIKTDRLKTSAISYFQLSTLYPSHYLMEPVTINLKNISIYSRTLTNAYFVIKSSAGLNIYQSAPQTFTLGPGQQKTWSWNQKNSAGQVVSAGSYTITMIPIYNSYTFTINSTRGSSGYFTFVVGQSSTYRGETFRAYLSQPTSVRDAIDNYYGKNKKGIPIGTIADTRPNYSPYNPQYHWQLIPKTIRMVEGATEICDGLPSAVEKNLDGMFKAGSQYCPWQTRVRYLF